MRLALVFILFFCFAKFSFAQKNEVRRYEIINSEEVDSAYLKSILQKIYSEAIRGNILAFSDYKFEKQLGIEEVKKVGEFCEWLQLYDCPLIDTLICTEADSEYIETYSLKYNSFTVFPNSISIELCLIETSEYKNCHFWVNFSDLDKILDEKQISYLLNATSFLPSETIH